MRYDYKHSVLILVLMEDTLGVSTGREMTVRRVS